MLEIHFSFVILSVCRFWFVHTLLLFSMSCLCESSQVTVWNYSGSDYDNILSWKKSTLVSLDIKDWITKWSEDNVKMAEEATFCRTTTTWHCKGTGQCPLFTDLLWRMLCRPWCWGQIGREESLLVEVATKWQPEVFAIGWVLWQPQTYWDIPQFH